MQDEMLPVRWSNYKKVQEYSLKFHTYMNHCKLCTDINTTSTVGCSQPEREHIKHLMRGALKDNDWTIFTLLMYTMMNTLADNQEEVIVNMTAYDKE